MVNGTGLSCMLYMIISIFMCQLCHDVEHMASKGVMICRIIKTLFVLGLSLGRQSLLPRYPYYNVPTFCEVEITKRLTSKVVMQNV